MSDEKPTVVPVEFAGIGYSVSERGDGRLTLDFGGQAIPSLPGVRYGLVLRPETTKEEAEQLAILLEKHARTMFAGFLDRVEDEEWQRWLTEMYDDMGYFDPTRPLGPGDEIAALANGDKSAM